MPPSPLRLPTWVYWLRDLLRWLLGLRRPEPVIKFRFSTPRPKRKP